MFPSIGRAAASGALLLWAGWLTMATEGSSRAVSSPAPRSQSAPTAQAAEQHARATCSGCHKSETGTNFLHVRLRDVGTASPLSTFLTQELSPGGPRMADFQLLLNTADLEKLKDGTGRDHDCERERRDRGDRGDNGPGGREPGAASDG